MCLTRYGGGGGDWNVWLKPGRGRFLSSDDSSSLIISESCIKTVSSNNWGLISSGLGGCGNSELPSPNSPRNVAWGGCADVDGRYCNWSGSICYKEGKKQWNSYNKKRTKIKLKVPWKIPIFIKITFCTNYPLLY